MSGSAGTLRYMAPEWADQNKEGDFLIEDPTKLDIYAIGIILADLICNPKTAMEMQRISDAIKSEVPKLPSGYGLEGSI